MSKNVKKAKINVEFNEATTRENLVSGESVNTLFGKIKKIITDLHDTAFTGNAAKVNNHTVNTDVPSDAKFTDTNTWRDVVDNLTSTDTAKSLSANQGKVLKGLIDGKAATSHTHSYANKGTLTSENLNNVITPGFYNAAGDNTVANKPSGIVHFGLIVIHRASGSYYTQILYNDTSSYRRFCINGTWGSWALDKFTDTTYSNATTSAAGLMSAADKAKLDELSGGGSGGSSSSTRKSIVIDIDNTTTIDIPFTINDTKNLVVYLNGILLVPSIHYTATTSQITLTGYTTMSGDIVTFVGNENVSTSVDILATEVGIQDTANNFPDANSVENALIQLANITKELTNANKTNVKLNTDNAMTAKFIAQSNTDYAIKQVRNIIIIPKSQADNLPQGEPGDICIVYNDE